MAATVQNNIGTVQEHIALCCATDWACEFSKERGPVRYVDTHAMAPFNHPVGSESPQLLDTLRARLRKRMPNQPEWGTRSYFESVRLFTRVLRDRGIEAWYPTHFLHAWAAARSRCVPFNALLFENDGKGKDRSARLSTFLPIASFLVSGPVDQFTAELAPLQGDFRVETSWPVAGGGEAQRRFPHGLPRFRVAAQGK